MGRRKQEGTGLMFPKRTAKRKRKRHPASLLHSREEKTCYLCMLLEESFVRHLYLEEHHIFFSGHQRSLSEEYGLKVYLCSRHHREGPEAVHGNQENRRLLEASGQQAFEERYGRGEFLRVFGRNYL